MRSHPTVIAGFLESNFLLELNYSNIGSDHPHQGIFRIFPQSLGIHLIQNYHLFWQKESTEFDIFWDREIEPMMV